MKAWTKYDPATGEVVGWSSGLPYKPEGDYVESPPHEPTTPSTHYVMDGVVKTYTPAQKALKAGMQAGFTWSNQTMTAVDLRSPAEKLEMEQATARLLRAQSYPPLTDLADALVHQSMGNDQPLQDYLAACRAVKENIPKPNVA